MRRIQTSSYKKLRIGGECSVYGDLLDVKHVSLVASKISISLRGAKTPAFKLTRIFSQQILAMREKSFPSFFAAI